MAISICNVTERLWPIDGESIRGDPASRSPSRSREFPLYLCRDRQRTYLPFELAPRKRERLSIIPKNNEE
jgi:hypothetical protein